MRAKAKVSNAQKTLLLMALSFATLCLFIEAASLLR